MDIILLMSHPFNDAITFLPLSVSDGLRQSVMQKSVIRRLRFCTSRKTTFCKTKREAMPPIATPKIARVLSEFAWKAKLKTVDIAGG